MTPARLEILQHPKSSYAKGFLVMYTNKVAIFTAAILAFVSCRIFAAEPAGASAQVESNLAAVASAIDKKSHDEIGVGIAALGILLEAKPGGFFLVDSLNSDGRMNAVMQLERKGFVQVLHVKSGHDEMVQLIPTEKARPIIKALKARAL